MKRNTKKFPSYPFFRNFYALPIDGEKEEKDGSRQGFSKKRLEIDPEEKKEDEKYLDEYDYYTDEYGFGYEKDEEKQVRELPYKSERGEDKLINHNSKE